jgi:hypothetical protein
MPLGSPLCIGRRWLISSPDVFLRNGPKMVKALANSDLFRAIVGQTDLIRRSALTICDHFRRVVLVIVLLLLGFSLVSGTSLPASQPVIRGRLLEACSCRVPCPCNVGGQPGPRPICESLAFFEIQNGALDRISLSNVHFALAERSGVGAVLFLDVPMTSPQSAATRRIAEWILSLEGVPLIEVVEAPIVLNIGDTVFTGSVQGANNHLTGRPLFNTDGRPNVVIPHPIIFGTFPVLYAQKGVSTELAVRAHEFSFDYRNTNLNNGVFEFSSSMVGDKNSRDAMQ